MFLEKILNEEIRTLAYSYYEKRSKGHGYDLEDWEKAKRTILYRTRAGFIYLILGLFLFFQTPWLMCFLRVNLVGILWCFAWSSIGAGASLINTRNNPQNGVLHLIGYWLFIILAVSVVSFTVSLYNSDSIYPDLDFKFYSLAASIGLIGGFIGHVFYDLIINIMLFLSKDKA